MLAVLGRTTNLFTSIMTVVDLASGRNEQATSDCVTMCERPLPIELGTCLLIHEFLSPSECADLIARAERRGFVSAAADYPPSYRNNERQVDDDPEFANELFQRLRGLAPETVAERGSNQSISTWRLHALNERIRWCRYSAGQQFNIHQDGVHHRGSDRRSRLTFMIYLSGPEAFEGGDTLFYRSGPDANGDDGAPPVAARVRPRAGSLIIFDHAVWHAGDTVTRGVKHILRSDLIYRRDAGPKSELNAAPFTPGHDGYVWTLLKLSDGRIASAGRDGTIRLWSQEGKAIGCMIGHRQSVLGLSEVTPGVLASVSRDRTVRLWNLVTQTCLRSMDGHTAAVLSISKVTDSTFATGAADSSIVLRDHDGHPLCILRGHTDWVWALASPDANTLASASEDGSVRIWDVHQDACITTMPGQHPLRAIAVQSIEDHSQHLVATGDAAGWLRLWSLDRQGFNEVARFKAHEAAVRRVRFLSRGRIATCGEDHRLRVWCTADFAPLLESRQQNFVTDVVELGQNELLCSGYGEGMTVVVGAD